MTVTTQTVRDIATESPATVCVFERYGIDYCCGGQVPLADACAVKGLNVDEVIGSLEAATTPLASKEKDWGKESLASLATHIVDTHHAQVSHEEPRLNELAGRVVSRHGDTREELPAIQSKLAELRAYPTFRAFYEGLRQFEQDLHQHMHLENNILFPRAVELEASVFHQ